ALPNGRASAPFLRCNTTLRHYPKLMLTSAVVRAPAPNFFEGLTTAGLGAPNYGRALEQHEAYCAALERCGLRLTRLKADPNYPDSTFVEDTAVVLSPRS